MKVSDKPQNVEQSTKIPQLCHLRKINGESAAFLFLKRLLRKTRLFSPFDPSSINFTFKSLSDSIDYLEDQDLTVEDIHSMISKENLPLNEQRGFEHKTLKTHRDYAEKIISYLFDSLLVGLDQSFFELSESEKAEFIRNVMSFLSRIARVKMLCVFHSLQLDSSDIQDLCFKRGFIHSVKENLSKIMRLLMGGVYSFDFLAIEIKSKEVVDKKPDPGIKEIQQMVNKNK